MSMISLGIALELKAKQIEQENRIKLKRREERAKISAIKSLRKELVKAYKINPGKDCPPLEDSVNSLNKLFTKIMLDYETELPKTRITQIDENTPPDFVKNTIKGFKDYLDQVVESSKQIREFNYKQDTYRGKLPKLTAILYNLKNFASTISNQINLYLKKENPTHLEQTKILHYINRSLEQITRKYRIEIGRIISKRGRLCY